MVGGWHGVLESVSTPFLRASGELALAAVGGSRNSTAPADIPRRNDAATAQALHQAPTINLAQLRFLLAPHNGTVYEKTSRHG